MSGWESLYSTATGDYNNGNYKDSYNNYLKAANALLYKLNHEVSFTNRDNVKTKPHNAAHLFTQLKSCVQRLEDILENRATNGTISSPQPHHISDLATSMITVNPTPQHLPLIPFSPLTRQSMHHSRQLAIANAKVSLTKQKSSDNSNKDLPILRKLDEEIRHHRNKFDNVNNQIQSVSEVTLLHWDPNDVSRQLTIIESELYKKVDFKKDLILIKDKRTSKAQACMDFHRYLTNSFTHQFMIYADMTRFSANSSRGVQHPKENIISHAVKVAHILLNFHRNFNSFAALIKALTSPEVRRIRRLWTNLQTRTQQQIKEFSSLIKKEDDYKVYKEILAQKMDMSRDVQGMVVIPWMQPHYEEIRSITQSYTSGKSGDNTGVILSAPGQRKLALTISLLEQCQSNANNDEEWNSTDGTRKVSPSSSHKTSNDRTTGPLDRMGNGNLELHHWLVSRVYLTKQQLIDESLEIEPLGENEVPLCVENEYDEEEEESDHNSVRYDIGSEDGGDNIEAGTSSNHEVTNGSRSQFNKPSPNKLEEHNNGLSKSLLTSKHERSESGSKSIVNGTSSTSVPREIFKPEENVEAIDNGSVGTNSLIKTSNVVNSTIENSFTSSSTTKAIPIPQPAGQKSHQLSLSPASMLTNLNPNAPAFFPRNLSSSAPGPTSVNNINISISDLTEMGKSMGNVNNTTDDDDDEKFVYPSEEVKDEEVKDDDDDTFVYSQVQTETTSSNDSKDNTEDDDMVFVYPEEEKLDAENSQDEGEGTSGFVYNPSDNNSSDNNNNNTNINKNEVPTKVDNKHSDSITVKLTDSGGITKVQE